jgi:VanZ family protein
MSLNFIKVASRVLFFVFLIVIEYLATTSLSIEVIENSWDKANHFVAFFALFIALSTGFPNIELISRVLLLMFFGIHIEVVQAFLPFREFSLLDIFADFIGVVIGILSLKIFRHLTI